MHQDVIAVVSRYCPSDERDRRSQAETLAWLKRGEPLTYPQNEGNHLTADGWLLSPDYSQVLLTFHHKFKLWVQLGGHVDAGETLIQAALREVREESGIATPELIQEEIFDLDVHSIDCYAGAPHFHHDIRFLMRSPTWEFTISPESDDLRWFRPEDIDALEAQGAAINNTLTRMTRKWREFLAKL